MSDFLIQHAITNVWCAPKQDQQVVFAPTRISGPEGVVGVCPVLWDSIPMPDAMSVFHVYQIGQVSPGLLNLLPDPGVWRLVAENMKDNNLIMDVFTLYGMQLPRIETYILVNRDKNVLLAIKDQRPLFDVRSNQIFLRLYSNAYFTSMRETPTTDKVDIYGRRVRNNNDTVVLQNLYNQFRALPGLTTAFVGGYLVDRFNPFVVPDGTVVEFVYDSSVKRVVEFEVADLQTFTSTLDSKIKYLLHYVGAGDGIVDYVDDIDVYLINRNVPGPVPLFQGVYYNKNSDDAMRMVTHKDYSITVPYVDAYATHNLDWTDANELTVRLHIRNSGFARPLVSDVNRILDLYRLPEPHLTRAFLGTDATLANWRAATLEASVYTQIMRTQNSFDITEDMVEAAYGYGAISRVLGDGPVLTQNAGGVSWIDVPPGLQNGCTMLEYNSSGVLLGFRFHPIGYAYQTTNVNAAWVEPISGTGTSMLTSGHSVQDQILVPYQNHRFYSCPLSGGQPVAGGWVDVTGDTNAYTVTNNVVTWTVDFTAFATLVRDDGVFLLYNHTQTPADGQFLFSIASTDKYNGVAIAAPMLVPPGQIDLYLNGHILVEGVDYLVSWPQVCIINTSYLIYNTNGSVGSQVVTVVGTGFCNSDLTRIGYTDTGFVKYGVMSRNAFVNLRDDKVLKIGMGGGVFPRSAVEFSEDNPIAGMTVVPNGSLYGIRQVIVPTLNYTNLDTYTLYTQDSAVDLAVENYMTQYVVDKVETNPDFIPDLYVIYSPFCAKIIFDLVNDVLSMAAWTGQYSELDVRNALTSYTHLLDYEPTYLTLDTTRIVVAPHNLQTVVTLNYYQHKFLAYAVDTFLNNKVDLTDFVDILPTLI
jgi:hypothetical protein